MLLIEGPAKTITTTYRRRSKSRLAFFLFCLRHPILAIYARSKMEPTDPITARDEVLIYTAIGHGLVTWFISTHS